MKSNSMKLMLQVRGPKVWSKIQLAIQIKFFCEHSDESLS